MIYLLYNDNVLKKNMNQIIMRPKIDHKILCIIHILYIHHEYLLI